MKIYKIAIPLPFEEKAYDLLEKHDKKFGPYSAFFDEGLDRVDENYSQEQQDYIERKFPQAIPIGSGSWGVAYDIGDDKVLKITYCDLELRRSQMLMKKPADIYVNVYDVNTDYNYIIIEKVIPLNLNEKILFNLAEHIFNSFGVESLKKATFGNTFSVLKNLDIHEYQYAVEQQNKKDALEMDENYVRNKFKDFLVFLSKTRDLNIRRGDSDIHFGNVGWRKDGSLCILDLG